MVTCAKAGIFKPLERMNCHVTTTSPLPRSHVYALRDPNWKEDMLYEYNALITNETWVLVPHPANRIIASLHSEFAMTDLGSLNYFLGISSQRSASGLILSQSKFAKEVLERAYMQNFNPCRTPDDKKSKVTLSRFSAEAEYRGIANVVAETAWIRNLLCELYTPLFIATLVYCDNVSAVYMSANPVQHQHIFTKGLPTALFLEFRTNVQRHPVGDFSVIDGHLAEKRSWKEILNEITYAIRFKLAGLSGESYDMQMALYLHLYECPPCLYALDVWIFSHGYEYVAATMIRFGICLEGNVVLMATEEEDAFLVDYVEGGLSIENNDAGIVRRCRQIGRTMTTYDSLKSKYMAEDSSSKKFPDFKHTLKHGKDDLSLVQLGSHLRIEESLRAQDSDKGKDSSATTHMCKDHCRFKTYEQVEDGSVLYMGDDHFALVYGKESVALEFSSGKPITLFNVLYVPKLRKNLVSGPVLNKCGYKQVYEFDKYILSKCGVFVGFVYYNNCMVMLNLNKVPADSDSVYMSSSTVVNTLLWHAHLGHVHYKRMLKMYKDNLISAIDENPKKCTTFCKSGKLLDKELEEHLSFKSKELEEVEQEFLENCALDYHELLLLKEESGHFLEDAELARVFKYLRGTKEYSLSYVGYPSMLEGYSDSSWINHVEDSSFTSRWVFLLGGGVISWDSKKQTCITSSTMEYEFVALADGGKEQNG
nr:zinc finger, CCHC-type [Tanacetum cinerariifolium]